MEQAHFFSLPSQGNIYTHTYLELINGVKKLLFASLNAEVFCLDYIEDAENCLIPTVSKISFKNIPSGAEIISLSAFNKSTDYNDFLVGITIIRINPNSNLREYCLNVYSQEDCGKFKLENISQNCITLELKYIPYQLSNTYLISWINNECQKEAVFMLSGSDKQMHIYKENPETKSFIEIEVKDNFPELENPPSVIMWLTIRYFNDYKERLTVYGSFCGHLKITRYDTRNKETVFYQRTNYSSTISNVIIYEEDTCNEKLTDPNLNIVVVNAILPAVVIRDVLRNGLTKYAVLKKNRFAFITTCAAVGDINFDGNKEIITGNSVEELIFFESKSPDKWDQTEIKKLVSPLFGLYYFDITGDGVKELIAISMKGVYIFKHKYGDVNKAILRKIDQLTIPQIDNN